MKKCFSFLLIAYSLWLSAVSFSRPAYAQTPAPWAEIEQKVLNAPNRCYKMVPDQQGRLVETATIQGFECLMINVLRIITPLVGLVMFFTLVGGAFKYLTAGGDQKKSQQAQKTITFAIIGIVVFVGIWFVLKLIQTITGVDVTQFKIPGP